jgi:short-chain fatty acids transporter
LEGGSFIWGVVIQFPFYAGIFGIIKFSGLADVMGDWFTAIASKETYPFIVVWYSGFLNYIVPSGGSKWAIEAPYIMTAAKNLGVSSPVTVIAYAWGDMVTDVIQPFWAIPLLGVAKLGFRDIMGYCMVYFLIYMVVISIGFLALPYIFPY